MLPKLLRKPALEKENYVQKLQIYVAVITMR